MNSKRLAFMILKVETTELHECNQLYKMEPLLKKYL